MKSSFSSHSLHLTSNQLFFTKVRFLQFEVDLLRSYLLEEESSRVGGAGLSSEIEALEKVSSLLFDGVYKPLRDCWH